MFPCNRLKKCQFGKINTFYWATKFRISFLFPTCYSSLSSLSNRAITMAKRNSALTTTIITNCWGRYSATLLLFAGHCYLLYNRTLRLSRNCRAIVIIVAYDSTTQYECVYINKKKELTILSRRNNFFCVHNRKRENTIIQKRVNCIVQSD